MNIGGILSKLESKADWAAYILEAWEAIPTYGPGGYTGVGGMIQWFLQTDMSKGGALNEIKQTFSMPGLLETKLKGNHIYATGLKYGAAAWILQELGFLTKYSEATEKVIKASAIALITLPGSGPYGQPTDLTAGRRNTAIPSPSPSLQIAGAF
jgi:hypothetical protein